MSLTNSKADVMDQLESANRKLSSFTNVETEIVARDEAAKEKDKLIINLRYFDLAYPTLLHIYIGYMIRNQLKHLNEELQRQSSPEMTATATMNDNDQMKLSQELEQARDIIRSLNSQNSELRSKLEVLASATRECSETRSNSSASETHGTNHDEIVDNSFSDSSSSESFEEVTAAASSDSFVEVKSDVKSDMEGVQQTVIATSGMYIDN